MYERLSDSARTVVSLAEAEAFARGATQVEPEDLLVALAQHPGVAGSVLRAVAVDPALVRDAVAAAVAAAVPGGPTAPAAGQGSPPAPARTRPLPLSEVTMTAFGLAVRESEGFKVPYVATEHLLLGLLREPTGRVADLLLSLRRDPGTIRERLFDLVATPGFVSPEQPLPPSAAAEAAAALDAPPAVAPSLGGGFGEADRELLLALVAEVRRLQGEVAALRAELGRPGASPRVREDREGRRPA
jgi:ATP-dependent Clp protease ATP-binding subunit ClpA